MDAEIKTTSSPLFLANGTTNSTTAGTSIANPAWTTSPPSGVNVFQMGAVGGSYSSNSILVVPFGVGSNTNTFLMSVFAWDHEKAQTQGNFDIWVAWPLATFTCTLTSSITGFAGTDIPVTNFGVDTVSLNVGTANISNEIISPTGGLQASIIIDSKGCKYIQILFAMNSSATSANALVRRL